MKVNCDGMDMNLGELKLAIKDIKGIKNVTDFDLQVENSQTKLVYSDEAQLIPRGTTVQVSSDILILLNIIFVFILNHLSP